MTSKFSSLRAVTYRLNNTPVKELPHIAYYLASSIQDCSDVLRSTSERPAGKDDDLALQVYKLKAKLASLLQDRSPDGRFTAVVLVKATVEAGGREILGSCEAWLRGLLAILSKPDPVSSKKLCLLTITRIFSLTQQYPTLIREITTRLLPAFLTACMNLAALNPPRSDDVPPVRTSPYLEIVLQCMLKLIPDHPSTFRPFVSKLQTTLVKLIGGHSTSDDVTHLAQSALVTLHFCAPKNTAGEEWLKAYRAGISSIHGIADQILRAIIEDWESSNSAQKQASPREEFDEVPRSVENDPLGLPTWQGIFQGSRVLISLLHFLKTFLLRQTAQLVELPLGLILDLTLRLLYVRVPTSNKESRTSVRFNPEVGREEREDLMAVLPKIHNATLDLLSSLVDATGLSILPVSQAIMDQCLWVFGTENSNENIRLNTYQLIDTLMPLIGPSITKERFKPLLAVIELCCRDASASSEDGLAVQSKTGSNSKPALNGHADSYLQPTSKKATKLKLHTSVLEVAASRLLCHILEYIPAQAIPHSLRAQIDRTAILMDQKRLLLASVLNPAPKTSGKYTAPSMMPFLARTAQDELEVEGLLRPRMPVVREVKGSSYEGEQESAEDFQGHLSKRAEPAPADGRSNRDNIQPAINGSGMQNDILDRLEDSLEDRDVSSSQGKFPPPLTTDHVSIEPLSRRDDAHASTSPLNQGLKRVFDPLDVQKEDEEPSKRIRSSEVDMEPHPVGPLKEITSGNAATTAIVVESSSVIMAEPGLDATIVGKGKGRASSVSPTPEESHAFGNEKVDNDDESDSDMPPLYLKTTESEEEEDDDDEML